MFELRTRRSRIILQIVLLLMVIPYAIPLVQMVSGSLGGRGFHNYVAVWETGVVPIYFRNSAIISGSVILLVYIFSMTAGFGFSKLRIFGKDVYFLLILVSLTLPEVILLSPLFVTFQKMHMFDTFFAVILPTTALQMPFTILITRNFIDGIPSELMEAARIDGAGELRTFNTVVVPMIKPGVGALAIFTFINSWNDYFMQLIMLSSTKNLTISLGIAKMQAENSTDFGLIMAGAAFAAIPIIIVFLIFQKYFTKGITMGAVKG